MTTRAGGTFEVKMSPQVDGEEGGACVGRMLLDKRFSGDLEATSRGQMLAVRAPVEGSAGYVAMELVTGALPGARAPSSYSTRGRWSAARRASPSRSCPTPARASLRA